MTRCIIDSSCIQLLSNNKIEWNFKDVNIVTINLKERIAILNVILNSMAALMPLVVLF